MFPVLYIIYSYSVAFSHIYIQLQKKERVLKLKTVLHGERERKNQLNNDRYSPSYVIPNLNRYS